MSKSISLFLKLNDSGSKYFKNLSKKLRNKGEITPHVSLIQGKTNLKKIKALESWMKYNAPNLSMEIDYESGLSLSNPLVVCLNVKKTSPSFLKLEKINKELSQSFDPFERLDSVNFRVENNLPFNKNLIEKYGRDFYTPENFSAHTTVFYGIHHLTQYPDLDVKSFPVSSACIAEIDFYGNPTSFLHTISFE